MIVSNCLSQLSLRPGEDVSQLATVGEEEWLPCTAWEYDTSFWQRTIIMDFDLVCDVSICCVIRAGDEGPRRFLLVENTY